MNAQEFETLLAHYDEAKREGQTLAFISPESGAELIEYARQLRDELARMRAALDAHRAKAFVTCDRDCFCWDADRTREISG